MIYVDITDTCWSMSWFCLWNLDFATLWGISLTIIGVFFCGIRCEVGETGRLGWIHGVIVVPVVPVVPLSPPNFVISCEQLSVIAAINGGELVLVLCFFFCVMSSEFVSCSAWTCVCLKMRCAPNSEGSHHQLPNWKQTQSIELAIYIYATPPQDLHFLY